MRKCFIFVAMISLAACNATTSTKTAVTYAAAPAEPEKATRAWMEKTLFDPYSVQSFALSESMKGSVWTGLINKGRVPAWHVCARFNAKNRYGAYTGLKTHVLHFRGETVWVANDVDDIEMHEHKCKGWNPIR